MRQHQKHLIADRLHAGFGHGFRLKHAVNRGDMILQPAHHFGPHCLRAKHRNLDPIIAIGHRQPFSEANGGVFRHPVRRGPDLIEQTRCRSGVEQVTSAPRAHQRHQMPRGAHMAHHVDLPNALPIGIRHLDPALDRDASVGAE